MRKALLAMALFLLLLAPARAAVRRADTVRYTPPAAPGDIYTVINFARNGSACRRVCRQEALNRRGVNVKEAAAARELGQNCRRF